MKVEILTVDEATRNLRVYPRNIIEEAILKLEDRLKDEPVLVSLSEPPVGDMDFLINAAAFVKGILLENKKVILDVDFIENPNGYALKEGVEKGYLHIRPSGIGAVNARRNGLFYIDDYEFYGFFGTTNPA